MDKPNPSPEIKMDAYIILLHLRSQGWTNFTEIRKLFCWDNFKMGLAIGSVGHINAMIMYLSEQWNEDIPRINAFLFTQEGKHTDYVCKEVFGTSGEEEQSDPQETAKYAAKITAYPKWDKVVEELRREAFEAQDKRKKLNRNFRG